MTTKGPLCKQVIVPMNSDNIVTFMSSSSNHIININRLLKNIKSECKADYIRVEKSDIIIVINKVILALDLQTMENYIKNSNQIDMDKVETSELPQSKSYLKIISLQYLMKNMNVSITSDVFEKILKNNHIFNNILIVSWPRIIKVFPKLDMAIIWLDIWNSQSSINTRGLINRCFNVGSFIATIWGMNMNLSVSQCKKYWKWDYSTHSCKV